MPTRLLRLTPVVPAFDARRSEIRSSALEVLFDTLRYHGAAFAQSFWLRIFDSVLLPIFDHVRAEVSAFACAQLAWLLPSQMLRGHCFAV